MPTFELVLLLRKLPTVELKSALKRTAESIFEIGGVLRKIDNLGFQKLPYRIKGNCGKHTEANRFVYEFDSSAEKMTDLEESLKRDMDLVRYRILVMEDRLALVKEMEPECDIHLDLLPVVDRPHVKKMVELSKKNQKKPFEYGGGRNYDPLAL